MAEVAVTSRGVRKERLGVVVSRSGNKSIVVMVERRAPDPMYGKVMRHHRKFHAHDEGNEAEVGDRVRIVECRPVSRMKSWRLAAVVQKRAVKPEAAEIKGGEAAV
jgi:small subunit ribosomal protein S17